MEYKNQVNSNILINSTNSRNGDSIHKKSINSKINNNFKKYENPFYFYMRFSKTSKIFEVKNHFYDHTLLLTKVQKKKLKEFKRNMQKRKKENLSIHVETNKNLYKNMLPINIWVKCENNYENLKNKFPKIIKINGEIKEKNMSKTKYNKNEDKFIKKIKLRRNEDNRNKKAINKKESLNTNYIKDNNKVSKSVLNKKSINQKNKFDNFNKKIIFGNCLNIKNIRYKFENQGLNKFIESINKKINTSSII